MTDSLSLIMKLQSNMIQGNNISLEDITMLRMLMEEDKHICDNYKKAFDIMMEHFESIPEELREEVDERLKDVGC